MSTPGLIERDDTILLVIDLQEAFLKKVEPARAALLVDNCRFLVETAIQLDIPTFVTVEDPEHNGWTCGTVRSRLAEGTPERDKFVFGLCGQADLRQAMLDQPRRTAVLSGLETDVCVLHSAVGLLGEGFRTLIVGDAAGAPGAEHEFGLARAAALGVEIIHTKGVYYEWMRTLAMVRDRPANARIAPPIASRL